MENNTFMETTSTLNSLGKHITGQENEDYKKSGKPNGIIPASSLEEYVRQITENFNIVSEYLKTSNHPQLSFERDTPDTTLPESAPEPVRTARANLMEAAMRTFQLMLGPKEYIPNLAMGVSMLLFYPVKSMLILSIRFNTSHAFVGLRTSRYSKMSPWMD